MRVAVVGHGASVVGKGWGPEIDAQPVVRMHNWHWQTAPDYGARCDYAFMMGPWLWRDGRLIERLPAKGFLIASLPQNLCGRLRKRSDPGPYQSFFLGYPVLQNTAAAHAFCDALGSLCPTRGGLAVVLAAVCLDATEIVMVGMDSLQTGTVTPYPKPYEDLTGGPHGWNGRPGIENWHNYAIEGAALRTWAAQRGVRLITAGEAWP